MNWVLQALFEIEIFKRGLWRCSGGMAVAEAGSCSSNLTPSLGTSTCGPKKQKKKRKRKCIGIELIYNVVLASGLQCNGSVIHIQISILFSHIGYYRTLSKPSCAIQWARKGNNTI